MPTLSRLRYGLRAWVALMAAYAFALQMLFTGMIAAQSAAAAPADPFAICYSSDKATDGGHNTGAPVAHQTCIVCTVAPGASLPPAVVHPIVFRFSVAVTFQPAVAPPDIANRSHTPRSSQGPPQTA